MVVLDKVANLKFEFQVGAYELTNTNLCQV